MKTPTLIPKMYSYEIVILIVYCSSSFVLAAHIYTRWFTDKKINFQLIYIAVMSFTVFWGFLIFDISQIFGSSEIAWIISFPLGFIIGEIAAWCDRVIVRYLYRRQIIFKNSTRKTGQDQQKNFFQLKINLKRVSHIPIMGQLSKRRKVGISSRPPNTIWNSSNDQRSDFMFLIIVAFLEEIIFRGFLVKVCFLLPSNFLIVISLVGSVALFSISHIMYGWPHVIAKLPLGGLTLITVVILNTVVPAIVGHIIFNIRVWKYRQNQPQFSAYLEQ